jgi:hypothetical protein
MSTLTLATEQKTKTNIKVGGLRNLMPKDVQIFAPQKFFFLLGEKLPKS